MIAMDESRQASRSASTFGRDPYLDTVQRLTRSIERLTAISEHLDVENRRLEDQARRRTLDDWFAYAIRDLATRQMVAYQDSVIRVDESSAAYRRGQAAAMGERLRSLIIGADTHGRGGRGALLVWVRQEYGVWEHRAGECGQANFGSDSDQHQSQTRSGWVSESALHVQSLVELETLINTQNNPAGVRPR